MNEVIKTCMFGKQKQASRQIEALVDLMERNIGMVGTADEYVDSVINLLRSGQADRTLCIALTGGSSYDKDSEFSYVVGPNGKVVFSCNAAHSDSVVAELKKEDDAFSLAENILSLCPPSIREELPQDNILAALTYSNLMFKEV